MKHEERGNKIFIAFLNRLSLWFWPKDQETHGFRGLIPPILALGFFFGGILLARNGNTENIGLAKYLLNFMLMLLSLTADNARFFAHFRIPGLT